MADFSVAAAVTKQVIYSLQEFTSLALKNYLLRLRGLGNRIYKKGSKSIIYKKESNGITGYKWFGIRVDVSAPSASLTDDGGSSITMRWDCRKHVRGANELVNRSISLPGSKDSIGIRYLVMSDAVEATVQVKPRQVIKKGDTTRMPQVEDGGSGRSIEIETGDSGGTYTSTTHGKIAARVGHFKGQIMLFRDARELTLPMWSTIPVPRGKQLHIDMKDLRITKKADSGEQVVTTKNCTLCFDIGRSTPRCSTEVDDIDVEVAWYPQEKIQVKNPDRVLRIGGEESFTKFIDDLRAMLGDLAKTSNSNPDMPRMLPEARAGQPAQWIHIELQAEPVVASGDVDSITLAIRDDKVYGVGFMNKSGVWYDLGKQLQLPSTSSTSSQAEAAFEKLLPAEYNSVLLGWSVSYRAIVQAGDWGDSIVSKLDKARLGKDFATKAVRMLSRYPDVDVVQDGDEDDDDDDGINPRVALAGLMIMVCESARLEPLRKALADGWDTGTRFNSSLIDYMMDWRGMSIALLRFMRNWREHDQSRISAEDALRVIRLVLNAESVCS